MANHPRNNLPARKMLDFSIFFEGRRFKNLAKEAAAFVDLCGRGDKLYLERNIQIIKEWNMPFFVSIKELYPVGGFKTLVFLAVSEDNENYVCLYARASKRVGQRNPKQEVYRVAVLLIQAFEREEVKRQLIAFVANENPPNLPLRSLHVPVITSRHHFTASFIRNGDSSQFAETILTSTYEKGSCIAVLNGIHKAAKRANISSTGMEKLERELHAIREALKRRYRVDPNAKCKFSGYSLDKLEEMATHWKLLFKGLPASATDEDKIKLILVLSYMAGRRD